MIDRLTNWVQHLTDSEASFWGSIVGAIIGVIGALLVGLLAIVLERSYQKRNSEKQILRDHVKKVVEAEILLSQLLSTLVKNERLFRKCAELKTPGHFLMTLPRVISFDLSGEGALVNRQIMNELVSLKLSVNLNSQLTDDFLNNYKDLTSFLMPVIAQKQTHTLDQKMIAEQYDDLKAFASSNKKSTHALYQRTLRLLAIIHLNGEQSERHKWKKVKKLSEFTVSEENIEAKLATLASHYSEKSMFQDV